MNENVSNKEIAAFIILTCALSAPVTAYETVMMPNQAESLICKYAGPPGQIPEQVINTIHVDTIIKEPPVLRYAGPQMPPANVINEVNTDAVKSIQGVKNIAPVNNFINTPTPTYVNTQFGNMQVIDAGSHFIFK